MEMEEAGDDRREEEIVEKKRKKHPITDLFVVFFVELTSFIKFSIWNEERSSGRKRERWRGRRRRRGRKRETSE